MDDDSSQDHTRLTSHACFAVSGYLHENLQRNLPPKIFATSLRYCGIFKLRLQRCYTTVLQTVEPACYGLKEDDDISKQAENGSFENSNSWCPSCHLKNNGHVFRFTDGFVIRVVSIISRDAIEYGELC